MHVNSIHDIRIKDSSGLMDANNIIDRDSRLSVTDIQYPSMNSSPGFEKTQRTGMQNENKNFENLFQCNMQSVISSPTSSSNKSLLSESYNTIQRETVLESRSKDLNINKICCDMKSNSNLIYNQSNKHQDYINAFKMKGSNNNNEAEANKYLITQGCLESTMKKTAYEVINTNDNHPIALNQEKKSNYDLVEQQKSILITTDSFKENDRYLTKKDATSQHSSTNKTSFVNIGNSVEEVIQKDSPLNNMKLQGNGIFDIQSPVENLCNNNIKTAQVLTSITFSANSKSTLTDHSEMEIKNKSPINRDLFHIKDENCFELSDQTNFNISLQTSILPSSNSNCTSYVWNPDIPDYKLCNSLINNNHTQTQITDSNNDNSNNKNQDYINGIHLSSKIYHFENCQNLNKDVSLINEKSVNCENNNKNVHNDNGTNNNVSSQSKTDKYTNNLREFYLQNHQDQATQHLPQSHQRPHRLQNANTNGQIMNLEKLSPTPLIPNTNLNLDTSANTILSHKETMESQGKVSQGQSLILDQNLSENYCSNLFFSQDFSTNSFQFSGNATSNTVANNKNCNTDKTTNSHINKLYDGTIASPSSPLTVVPNYYDSKKLHFPEIYISMTDGVPPTSDEARFNQTAKVLSPKPKTHENHDDGYETSACDVLTPNSHSSSNGATPNAQQLANLFISSSNCSTIDKTGKVVDKFNHMETLHRLSEIPSISTVVIPITSNRDSLRNNFEAFNGDMQNPANSQLIKMVNENVKIQLSLNENEKSANSPPQLFIPAQPQQKKRGRKKKVLPSTMNNNFERNGNDTRSNKIDEPMNIKNILQKKDRKKHDRFNGIPEEEVVKRLVPDVIKENLDILIIGINPGLYAAFKGHHYAGPGNHFWKCLHLAGLIPEQMNAEEDLKLLNYGIGFTNLVARATKTAIDISKDEIEEGCAILLEKIKKFKPKIVVFNGKYLFEMFSSKTDFHFGKQQDCIQGTTTWVWVMPSSSARCAQLPRAIDKVPFYGALKKFRDYLNGIVDVIEEEECIFSDDRIQQLCLTSLRSVEGRINVTPTDLLIPINETLRKKKRGRPKKVKTDEITCSVEKTENSVAVSCAGGGDAIEATNALNLSIIKESQAQFPTVIKKKRGRPKKIKQDKPISTTDHLPIEPYSIKKKMMPSQLLYLDNSNQNVDLKKNNSCLMNLPNISSTSPMLNSSSMHETSPLYERTKIKSPLSIKNSPMDKTILTEEINLNTKTEKPLDFFDTKSKTPPTHNDVGAIRAEVDGKIYVNLHSDDEKIQVQHDISLPSVEKDQSASHFQNWMTSHEPNFQHNFHSNDPFDSGRTSNYHQYPLLTESRDWLRRRSTNPNDTNNISFSQSTFSMYSDQVLHNNCAAFINNSQQHDKYMLSSSDMTRKSLSSLESLVDQIPSINENRSISNDTISLCSTAVVSSENLHPTLRNILFEKNNSNNTNNTNFDEAKLACDHQIQEHCPNNNYNNNMNINNIHHENISNNRTNDKINSNTNKCNITNDKSTHKRNHNFVTDNFITNHSSNNSFLMSNIINEKNQQEENHSAHYEHSHRNIVSTAAFAAVVPSPHIHLANNGSCVMAPAARAVAHEPMYVDQHLSNHVTSSSLYSSSSAAATPSHHQTHQHTPVYGQSHFDYGTAAAYSPLHMANPTYHAFSLNGGALGVRLGSGSTNYVHPVHHGHHTEHSHHSVSHPHYNHQTATQLSMYERLKGSNIGSYGGF